MQFRPPPPQVPRPHTTRGRWLARQRANDGHGRFSERLLQFNFPTLAPTTGAQLVQTVTSQGGRFLRLLAMRGTVASDVTPATGLEPSQVLLRVQLNGDNDLFGGNEDNAGTLASLFDDMTSPWFWFLSPPLLRSGDLITMTVANTTSGEGAPDLTPEIAFRLIDDELWQELYTRDWRRERSA